jgi:hypothetical protein
MLTAGYLDPRCSSPITPFTSTVNDNSVGVGSLETTSNASSTKNGTSINHLTRNLPSGMEKTQMKKCDPTQSLIKKSPANGMKI